MSIKVENSTFHNSLNNHNTYFLNLQCLYKVLLSGVEELLAFQYHTGEPYKDIEDLESKYFEYLESYERWSFLP